jgi:hypothetical protein
MLICFSYSLRYNASLDDMKKDQNITDERNIGLEILQRIRMSLRDIGIF